MSTKKIAIEVGGEMASDAKAASDIETLREEVSEEDSDEEFVSVGGKAPRVGQKPTNTFSHQSEIYIFVFLKNQSTKKAAVNAASPTCSFSKKKEL